MALEHKKAVLPFQIPMLSRSNWWSESLRLGGPGEPRTPPGVMYGSDSGSPLLWIPFQGTPGWNSVTRQKKTSLLTKMICHHGIVVVSNQTPNEHNQILYLCLLLWICLIRVNLTGYASSCPECHRSILVLFL